MKRFFRVLLFAMLLKVSLKCRETLIKAQHFNESGRGVHSRGTIYYRKWFESKIIGGSCDRLCLLRCARFFLHETEILTRDHSNKGCPACAFTDLVPRLYPPTCIDSVQGHLSLWHSLI